MGGAARVGLPGWGGHQSRNSSAAHGSLPVGEVSREENYAASVPGITARGPNFARARSATSSIRRTFSSTGSKVS